MSYPQGFLFQPSVSLALHSCPSFGSGSVVLGARAEELALGRSSSGSAFAPYAGSASFGSSSSPGFNSHLPYGGEPRAAATLNSFVGPGYDPSGITGPLDFHPFGGALQAGYPYGDPAYRKNATRDATATLKAWLNEHRKNPYPTKGEKIMLAIITKMTLTQVSTWFANARRRLKKENKMTWTPRNRSEDEEEDDNIDLERNDDDEEPPMMKPRGLESKMEAGSAGNRCELYKDDSSSSSSSSSSGNDTDRAFTEPDFLKERAGRRAPQRPGESSPRAGDARLGAHGAPASERSPSPEPKRCGGDSGPGPGASGNGAAAPVSPTSNPAPKPKLWSLAEIATSSDKSRGAADPAQGLGTHQRSPFPHSASLSRLYYGAPFIPGYSNYGTLGHLHNPGSTLGLHQTMLQRAEAMAMARDCKLRSHCTQLDLCKDLTHHELKKSMANV